MSSAILFSGQGSQYVGMCADLIEHYDVVRELVEVANNIVGYDLRSIMLNGPAETLTETRYTQPALFVHEAALLRVSGVREAATAVAGHSLGEYTALYAAGVLTFEDALRLVALRGKLMFEAGLTVPGTMAAVVGLDDDAVEAVCAELNGKDGNVLVAANFNSPGQVVISGSADYVRSSMPIFKERGAKIVKELQVSGAFHSPLLQVAAEPLAEALSSTEFHDAELDVYTNVTATAERRGHELRTQAAAQLTSPVRWTQTMRAMHTAGITSFLEVGPGKVLQGLVKRTIDGATIDGIDTAADVARIVAQRG